MMNTREQMRADLKALVDQKVTLTKERRAYTADKTGRPENRDELVPYPYGKLKAIDKWAWDRFWWCHEIDKRRGDLREQIRYKQLAYALLRGRPYLQQEPKCKEGNAPSAYTIGSALGIPDPSTIEDLIGEWLKGESVSLPKPEEPEAPVGPAKPRTFKGILKSALGLT